VTKSTLVLRDLDLLAALARVADVRVHVTVTTLDPGLWRAVEPGTPPPLKRLEILRRLSEAGVPTGVFMAPILPGLTDSAAAIAAVARAAKEHGAGSFWASPLRLAPLVKEHWLGGVGEAFPDQLPRYERAYTGASAPRNYLAAVEARVADVRARHGFAGDAMRRIPPPAKHRAVVAASPEENRQLALPL